MNLYLFVLSVTLAVLTPVLAVTYLRPILAQVLRSLCDAEGGAEFWLRSAYLLAVVGTLFLVLSFGLFESHVDWVESLRRTLSLILAGVFVTVAYIARAVWSQVRVVQTPRVADGVAAPSAPDHATLGFVR